MSETTLHYVDGIAGEKIGRAIVHVRESTDGRWFVGVLINGQASWRQSGTFPTREQALAYVQELRDAQAAKDARKQAERQALSEAKAAFINPHFVGELLNYSWGYEQTNQEFAQVVAVGPRSVTLQRIASRTVRATGHMSSIVAPVQDQFIGEPQTIRLTFYLHDGKLHTRIPARHGSWTSCGDREEFYCSWYA